MKQTWPAPQRNAAAILEVLQRVLPSPGLTLEIASGSGQHAAHFCEALPEIQWQPSDYDESVLPSIDAWGEDNTHGNFRRAVHLDVSQEIWPVAAADAIYCSNMIHISPWECTGGLFRGAGRVLPAGGVVLLYGPFLESAVETTESNLQFDASLKSRNPEWGLRHLDDVAAVANAHGLVLEERVAMPANNLCVLFRRQA